MRYTRRPGKRPAASPGSRSGWGGLGVSLLVHAAVVGWLFDSSPRRLAIESGGRPVAQSGIELVVVSSAQAAPLPPTPAAAQPAVAVTRRSDVEIPVRKPMQKVVMAPAVILPDHVETVRPPTPASPSPQPPAESQAATAAAAPSVISRTATLSSATLYTDDPLTCNIPQPPYPLRARRLKQGGTVVLRLTITPAGEVTTSQIASTSGFESLDEAALNAARLARCKPGIQEGHAVTTVASITINFSLDR